MIGLGSIRVPFAIGNQLNRNEYIVYGALRTFKNNETHKAYPSIPTLAKIIGMCDNSVRKYLRILQSKGLILIQERKVKNKVTNKKYNETNLYTFIAEKFGKVAENIKNNISKNNKATTGADNKIISIEKSDIETIKARLEKTHSKDVVMSAIRTMRKNIKKGSIINNTENYLLALINKADGQLKAIEKVLESSKNDNKTVSNINYSNKKKLDHTTKFHNFEQRTSKYTAEELERMVRRQ